MSVTLLNLARAVFLLAANGFYVASEFALLKSRGFRIDALRQTIKDASWRDNPVNPDWNGVNEYDSLIPEFSADQPEVQEVVAQIS